MKLRALYFCLGIAVALMAVILVRAWGTYHGWNIDRTFQEAARAVYHPGKETPVRIEDLVGTWHGEDSDHTTYTIVRHSDGTFTQDMDASHDLYRSQPSHTKYKGRWSMKNSCYTISYTESTDPSQAGRGPFTAKVVMDGSSKCTYSFDEGIWNTEHKE